MPDSFPGLTFHFQNFRSRIPRNKFQPLPSESKKYVPFRTLLNSNQSGAGIHWSSKPHQRTIHLLIPTSVCYYPNIQSPIGCSDCTDLIATFASLNGAECLKFSHLLTNTNRLPYPTNHHQASPLDPSAPLPTKPLKHHKTITPRFKHPCRPEKSPQSDNREVSVG